MEWLGKEANYWIELQRQAETLDVKHLIAEIAELRSKISYYESRIDDLAKFMAINLEVKP